MKNFVRKFNRLTFFMLVFCLANNISMYGQCTDAGFESGTFIGWSGSFSQSTDIPQTGGSTGCQTGTGPGSCQLFTGPGTCRFLTGPCTTPSPLTGCFTACIEDPCVPVPCVSVITGIYPDPFRHPGLSEGTPNQASNVPPQNSHFIMSSGFDAIVGNALPVVNPNGGGNFSARLGNAQKDGGGESMMYKYVVNATNSSFTYSYAVVLDGGTHTQYPQPFFKVRMFVYDAVTGDSTSISCAAYDVNGLTAPNIGGFQTTNGAQWKNWSSVTVPLDNYIGKTVAIQFITRDCCPDCTATDSTVNAGSHYAYAYIDASCDPLTIIPSAPAVCSGTNITLKAPAAKTYSWTGPGIVSGGNSQVVTVNLPGKYDVVMTTLSNAPCTFSLTATMLGSLPGGANVSSTSQTICTGGSATLTASGGVAYTWSTGQSTQSITVTPANTTTYTVNGTSGACGTGTATGTVTVNPIPTSPFTVTPVCVGVGSTITYTGNASASDTYNWNFNGGTATPAGGQGPFSVVWPTSGSKNVSLTVVVGTCTSTPTTNVVTVNPLPVVSITPASVCAGGSATLTAAGASTYVWEGGSSGATYSATPAATTTYSVTGTDANGCTGTASGAITILPMQDPTFSYNPATICKTGGSNPSITIASPGGTFSSSPAGLTLNTNTGAITVSSSNLGTYTVTYTTAGPCPGTSTFVINIVNVPKADFSLGIYCQSAGNQLPTFINGGSAGTFSSTAGLSFVSTSTGEIDLAASTPATYTVTNTINSPGCPVTTFDTTITINAVPVTTIDDQTVCSGTAATLTAGGATTYTWSNGAPAINTMTDTPASTTPYTVTGTTAGCSSSATGTITVNPIPLTTVDNKTVCEGTAATLTAGGATTYLWSGSTSGNTLTATPTATTSYTVTGSSLGCPSDAVGTITVNPIPLVTVNSPFICQGNSVNLTAAGATTYLWSTTSTANPISVTPAVTTPYTVTGTSLGCSATVTSTVTITLLPVVTVNSPVICIGQSAALNASGGATYDWSTTQTGNSITVSPLVSTSYTVADNTPNCSGFAVSNVTVNQLPVVTVNTVTICVGQSATLTASGASTYSWSNSSVANPTIVSPITTTSYTVTGTSIAGCVNTAITMVTVNPLPLVRVGSSSICEGLSTTLTASGANTYLWSNGTTTASTTVSPTSTTPYTVTGIDANGCSSTGTGTVTVFPKPAVDFSASPQPAIVSFPTITFTGQTSPDVNYWSWNFGDGDSLIGTKDPVHTYPTVETTYNVTLSVLNAGMCPNSVTHQVVIGPEYSFYIPNAFSPNGDGVNDFFFGKGKGILEYELMIFDRWGNFIFFATDIDKGWNGKANGGSEIAQQDVYVWKVALTDIFHKKHNFIGTVTLVNGD